MSGCPTPTKVRYATRSAAEKSAHAIAGVTLYVYECACTWYHLSSSERRSVTIQEPDEATVQYLAMLPTAEFRDIVAKDISLTADPAHSAALRHATLIRRWRTCLGQLINDIDEQLAARRKTPGSTEWRGRAVSYRNALTGRLSEAKTLSAEHQQQLARRRETHLAEAKRLKHTGASINELRQQAGEIAKARLIDNHRDEWTLLIVDAYQTLGLDVPDRIARHLKDPA